MAFVIDPHLNFTFTDLESISTESWGQTYSWTPLTKLAVKDQEDAARINRLFASAKELTFAGRVAIQQYIAWKMEQKHQVPKQMVLDEAPLRGYEIRYTPASAEIQSNPPMRVLASRVPLAERDLYQPPQGQVGVRQGSDVMAASLGSMTRWTGQEVVLSMPIDTMKKHSFAHAKVEGVRPFLIMIPPGVGKVGMKGRVWAYYLMAVLQKMSSKDYADFMTAWCQAFFSLPSPHAQVALSTVFQDNISLVKMGQQHYYRVDYRKPAILASMTAAYRVTPEYELMAQQIVAFAADRQGDSAGISMLAQSLTSWGLVSKSQAEIEQTVSLILGMRKEKTVVTGYTAPEYERIRLSVSRLDKKIKVFLKVEEYELKDREKQTATVKDAGLYLIRGRTALDSTLTAQKAGKIKTYLKNDAIEKMWSHVETATAIGSNVVYYAAGLPVIDTEIKVFPAGAAWSSVFFFSRMEILFRAQMTDQGLVYVQSDPIPPKDAHAKIISGMNTAISFWVNPPINRSMMYSGLLSPLKVTDKMIINFTPEDDTYDVYYADEVEDGIRDPAPQNQLQVQVDGASAPQGDVVFVPQIEELGHM